MLSTILEVVQKYFPPTHVASRIALIGLLVLSIWAMGHQSEAKAIAARQLVQDDAQQQQYNEIIRRLGDLQNQISKVDEKLDKSIEREILRGGKTTK
jgi:hypothetical protein